MNRKIKQRIDEVETQVKQLVKRVDNLCEDLNDDMFVSHVAYALRKILDTNQAITITHYINDKEVTTKLIRDELAELRQEERELSRILDDIKEVKEKYVPRN